MVTGISPLSSYNDGRGSTHENEHGVEIATKCLHQLLVRSFRFLLILFPECVNVAKWIIERSPWEGVRVRE